MLSLKKNRLLGLAGRFSLAGLLNTGLGFLIIFLLMAIGVDPYLSNAAGYVAGLVTSFALNRSWVFRSTGQFSAEVPKFAIAVALAYALNVGTLASLLKIGVSAYFAQIAAAVIYTVTVFVLSTYWIFRNHASQD